MGNDDDDDLEALASAWRAHAWRSFVQSSVHAHVAGRQRTTCGHCGAMLCLTGENSQASASGVQRLGELLRLLQIAARAGPDVFRLLQETPEACAFLNCAWCDDADDDVEVTVRVFGGGTEEPAILKDALFDWSETTATTVSSEYVALRDALLARAARQQPRARAAQSLGLSLSLAPSSYPPVDVRVYATHTDRLLRAAATADRQTTGLHVRRLTFDASNVSASPREVAELLTTVLSHAVPVSLDPYSTRRLDMSTLTDACTQGSKASLEYVTQMTLQIDQAGLDDASVVRRFCELLSTQCHRLERLTIVGSPSGDSEAQQRSLALLSAALLAPRRLQQLCISQLALPDAAMQSLVGTAAMPLPPTEDAGIEPCRVAADEHDIPETPAGALLLNASEDSGRCAALRTLWISCDASAQKRTLLSKIGANLTEISLSSSLPSANHIEILAAITRCCPRLTHLSVADFACDEAFVAMLTSATDAGDVCLRELSIDAEYDANVAACVQLLKILSDPRRRLTQTLEDLLVFASKYTLPVVRQATDLMLRCNAQLKCVEISYSDEEEEEEDDNSYAVQGGSDVRHDTAEFVPSAAVTAMLEEMAAAADGKTATQQNVLSPGVVVLPSMRRRVAFLSVLAARDVSLPPPVVVKVLLMAGRCPRVRADDLVGLRRYTCIKAPLVHGNW